MRAVGAMKFVSNARRAAEDKANWDAKVALKPQMHERCAAVFGLDAPLEFLRPQRQALAAGRLREYLTDRQLMVRVQVTVERRDFS